MANVSFLSFDVSSKTNLNVSINKFKHIFILSVLGQYIKYSSITSLLLNSSNKNFARLISVKR